MIEALWDLQGVKHGKNASKSTGSQGREYGRCLWIDALPEEYQDCQKLLNIFCCFGNVRRIVFTDEKPDRALIEMDRPGAAMKASVVSKNQTIGGKPFKVIQLDPTKFKEASIGKDDTKSMDLTETKESWRYAEDSKFRKRWAARLKQLSPKIIVANIPDGKEDMVKKHIIEAGYTVKDMQE